MRRNLTEYKVRMLLGNPNSIKGSLSPRIERVYHYHGDIDADGIEEKGLVNFFTTENLYPLKVHLNKSLTKPLPFLELTFLINSHYNDSFY